MKIYNTLTKKIETFIPNEKNKISMYVCGPTVYNLIHIGNARPIIFFDIVARYFDYLGYEVNFIQNFTDVDDKIINKALQENTDALSISHKYIDEFIIDTNKLNLFKGIIRPKVSENMQEIIDMISILIDKDYAYNISGDVYFRVNKFKDYGILSKQKIDDLKVGKRIEIDERKENVLDFALWKKQKENTEIYWESPFSKGRPGWHIECSALIKKYLGDKIDIHGGGFDLIFPHHENEIAQSISANNTEYLAKYWMHNAFIDIDNEKMSKSLGNTVLLRDLLNNYHSDIIKLMMLNTHYRKPINFNNDEIKAIQNMYNNLISNLEYIEQNISNKNDDVDISNLEKLEKEFHIAMKDDFNTSKAISTIIQRVKEISKILKNGKNTPLFRQLIDNIYIELKDILGLTLEREDMKGIQPLVDLLLELRQKARVNKDYATSDKIRDTLKEYGVEVNDKKV